LEDYKKTAKKFRSFLVASIGEKNYSDEINLIQQKNIPALIVFGKEEQHLETAYLDKVKLPLWRNEIFKLPGASHMVLIDQAAAFNKLLVAFAEEVFYRI
jgi:pimeloyl-ACP methyl ester carboxylesterase